MFFHLLAQPGVSLQNAMYVIIKSNTCTLGKFFNKVKDTEMNLVVKQ